ncbi:MAG: site-specific recombinase [Burkholderiaceae bacterium]
MTTRPELSELLNRLDPHAPLVQRHLWLMELLTWVRGHGHDTAASVDRVQLLLDAAAARPGLVGRWQAWWRVFRRDVDIAPMLADFGFAPRTAFLSELGHRIRRKLLPGTPETTDLAELFGQLLPTDFDRQWLLALPTALLERVEAVLFSGEAPQSGDTEPDGWDRTLLDALTFCVGQVSATGFAAEVRVRMSVDARQARTFHHLPTQFEALKHAVATHGALSPKAIAAATQLRHHLEECRSAAHSVYAHLDEHGISVGIVFRLQQLRHRIQRIDDLLLCLQSPHRAQAAAHLLAKLVQVQQASQSLRALVASSTHLTAAKVAERGAESGEHYITRNRTEYRAMLKQAAGGGAVIGFTTWGKFLLYGLALSPFWMGFAAGMNYALSFVLVQLLHWTVATKQPAVTAPAMVAKLKDMRSPGAVRGFVDEVANLFRSQIAAILGNLALVVPVVVLLSQGLVLLTGQPMVTPEQAHHVLHDMDVLGPTVLFAAFTGVLLFASSIIAGWFENWFVLHRLDSALAHNPGVTRWLGAARSQRWARFLRANVSGFAANISLGLMLGVIPVVLAFFGLGLEVRHVTLSAGQVAAAVVTLGPQSLLSSGFWLAVAGVVVVGPINLGVSFYLAFRLALRAQAISDVNRQRIAAAIRGRIRHAPLSFLRPPPDSASADEDGDSLPPATEGPGRG